MIPDLRRRIGLTLGALLICRIGANIPLPGLDSSALMEVLRSPGPAGMPGMLAGAGIRRVAILALGITPYLSSAVLLQIVMIVSRRMRAVSERGEIGRRSILRWTLALAAAIAAFQAYGVAVAIEGVAGLAPAPGLLFRLMVVATLTGGALFLAWLAELITARGIGNGLALILLLQVVTDVPDTLADVLTFNRQGLLSGNVVLGLGMIVVASTALVAFVELSCRRLPLIFSARGGTGGRQSYLAVKLNAAGAVIPVVLASWIMVAVTTVAIFGTGRDGAWWAAIAPELEQGHRSTLPFMPSSSWGARSSTRPSCSILTPLPSDWPSTAAPLPVSSPARPRPPMWTGSSRGLPSSVPCISRQFACCRRS